MSKGQEEGDVCQGRQEQGGWGVDALCSCLQTGSVPGVAELSLAGGPGMGDYQCPACGRCFTRHWHLKRHLATHLAIKPFRCPYCPHAANIKDNLKLHIRKIHQGEAQERSRPDQWAIGRESQTCLYWGNTRQYNANARRLRPYSTTVNHGGMWAQGQYSSWSTVCMYVSVWL